MRGTKGLCVTVKCVILMIGKFDVEFSEARTRHALQSWTVRFLKRNKLVVRRMEQSAEPICRYIIFFIKLGILGYSFYFFKLIYFLLDNVQDVADVFSRTVNIAVESDSFFSSFLYSSTERYDNRFNMDQTGVCIDNPGRLTIDVRGAKNVTVVQGMGENGARCSVFLCVSASS